MAWRIDEAVLRGEIDNRVRGCLWVQRLVLEGSAGRANAKRGLSSHGGQAA